MRFIYSDSLDFVDPRYDFIADRSPNGREPYWDDFYPHEILGRAPYDGLLISRAIVDVTRKYSLAMAMRLSLVGAREFLRYPKEKYPNSWVMGDCGAFSYHDQSVPPFHADDTVEFYEECRFTHGCSVDHVIFDFDETVRGSNGGSPEAKRRFDITLENAREFLKASKQLGKQFTPIGVAQGWSPDSLALAAKQLQAMGYRYIAAGGMVPLRAPQIHSCLTAIRAAINSNIGLHILGFAKADQIDEFTGYGITSFDSTSPLLRAFKDSKVNYYMPGNGQKLNYYMAIRIPQATENLNLNRLVKVGRVKQEKLIELERTALRAIRAYDKGKAGLDETLGAILEYSEVFLIDPNRDAAPVPEKRLIELRNAYRKTLEDRPWQACDCAICSKISVEVIIFRSSNRNKRRGIHNLYVYHNHIHPTLGSMAREPEANLFCN